MTAEDRAAIEASIPHRPPFLWIDRIVELEPGLRCVAAKRVGGEEAFFAGHFPGHAILPGVFLIEAAAQTAGVMLGAAGREAPGAGPREAPAIGLLAAVNHFKFLAPVRPESDLEVETRHIAQAGGMAYVAAEIRVSGEVVAKGELSLASG